MVGLYSVMQLRGLHRTLTRSHPISLDQDRRHNAPHSLSIQKLSIRRENNRSRKTHPDLQNRCPTFLRSLGKETEIPGGDTDEIRVKGIQRQQIKDSRYKRVRERVPEEHKRFDDLEVSYWRTSRFCDSRVARPEDPSGDTPSPQRARPYHSIPRRSPLRAQRQASLFNEL